MSWRDHYRSVLTTPEKAMSTITSGMHVYLGGNAVTPRALAEALARRGAELRGVQVSHVLLLGHDPFAGIPPENIRHRPFFVGHADRHEAASGRAAWIPCHLSDIPGILREGPLPLDVAVVMVCPPDSHGYVSLGVEVLASMAAARAAKRLILQVNPKVPRVHGDSFLHVSEAHAIVEAEEPLAELETAVPDETERAIAGHVLGLIPDAATLQLGIGGIPNAVIQALEGRSDLGVHSEMISDGVMFAAERGLITGARKSLHRGKIVATFAMGSQALYDWCHDNAAIEAHPCDYTNDLFVASRNDKLVALNSALSVDLSGQVNADSIGARPYSGVGGQLDFIQAAWRSKGGVPIIALPSTAKGGTLSRITPHLALGAGVVTPRASARYVVTEFGVADLWGKSLGERARALAAVAHPDFREGLLEAVFGA